MIQKRETNEKNNTWMSNVKASSCNPQELLNMNIRAQLLFCWSILSTRGLYWLIATLHKGVAANITQDGRTPYDEAYCLYLITHKSDYSHKLINGKINFPSQYKKLQRPSDQAAFRERERTKMRVTFSHKRDLENVT